jgi:hypothetical protein
MEWRFYVFVALLIGVPIVVFSYGIVKNSAGMMILGILLCLGAVGFALWFLAQLNTDI